MSASTEQDDSQPKTLASAQASQLLTSFTHFLTVCVHNILYYRSIYPAPTFLTSRAYNLPVHQSRHPRVCNWIRDAIDAVKAQLIIGTVERIAVVIYDAQSQVLERWMFDVATFPAWPAHKEGKGKALDDEDELANSATSQSRVNWPDVDEQLRAAVRRLAHTAEKLSTLPDGCTFTVAVELRQEGDAPIGHPQAWIPTQPYLQTSSKERPTPGQDVGGQKTTLLRSVEAGPLFFECWVEEGKAKLNAQPTPSSSGA